MEMIANFLLLLGTVFVAAYCLILSKRLKKLTNLESGLGNAVYSLSEQVNQITRTITAAQSTTTETTRALEEITARAEGISRVLEIQIAAMHDIPQTEELDTTTARTDVLHAMPPTAPVSTTSFRTARQQ